MNDGYLPSDEDNLADDALPPEISELAVPIALNKLFPWHRPRKQFVRENQWVHYTKRLLGKLNAGKAGSTKEIRYLTLPGIDYLDVRMLGDACKEAGCELISTSFLAAQEGNPVRARAQFREESLKQAGHLSDNSITLSSRLEEVAFSTSQAYLSLKKRAPFDIVNMDACGSIALPDAAKSGRLLDALHRLVELQFNTRTTNWLLFLTTDARPETLSPELSAAFKEAIVENAAHGNDFRDGAYQLFDISLDVALPVGLTDAAADADRFLRFYSLGLAKWLLKNSSAQNWEVKTLNCFFYSTSPANDPRPTMASLAFEFIKRPVALQDQFGVANAASAAYQPPENYSLRALRMATEMEDLDSRMMAEPGYRDELATRTKALLAEAGYQAETLAGYDIFSAS